MGCCNSKPAMVALEDLDLGPLYLGPKAQYEFLNVDVTLLYQNSISNTRLLTSDVEAYYPQLCEQYNKGYRMLTFYHIPCQGQPRGFFKPGVITTFQGIFCRGPQQDSNQRYHLRVEKAIIKVSVESSSLGCRSMRSSTVFDTSHIQQMIDSYARDGARLVCIELTGQEERVTLQDNEFPYKGVDVFFEYPIDRVIETYTYNTVVVPIVVMYSFVNCIPHADVSCDWQGNLDKHLKQGFRLVEIFMDSSYTSEVDCCSSRTSYHSKWYFEKPTSKMYDLTPVYEGKVIKHYIKVTGPTLSGVKTKTEWEPVMVAMGNNGWELACILETANVTFTSMSTFYMQVLLFFQRKIYKAH
ncbi:uncharacterized protein LOC106059310 [Biomphalaria glabrata]|uniref:Uncharacterized protein LOC106059310 n=1 Tax=Biomphalaria glabrata TaxID=6526 RepID=A0A9W3APN7_BIOGL|nr:uncharacterized protein LOC106059310 [Biomphalaria glabrata]XP_055889244.1 uncharacterized protein LOC106059310 [Biomphalaria glabrata]XP_055889253.1 uncharacterized protein LOC106059310 [Biomphalaria glabrata]XP_055889257.1 uncharacterized protein LOC106059310 [Biomphalaria glabrata]XP_055889264.1 uncharacterized protein LOC106059310 [Biomphalaria glabrata]XP_055889270.1 uncharacterized protein LOC106059310 [Biomphalaria glabrata]XP_055889276.1 uncharacterized protein LOC106059310 [Biomph